MVCFLAEEAETQRVVQQMHFRKLAKVIFQSKGTYWNNLVKDKQKQILAELLRVDGESEKFKHFVTNSYPKTIEQRNLGK